MTDATQGLQGLGKFVPGFDFLQGLVKNAGSTMPFSQWVAPTLDPKELDKRIDELRTVQFWLEQNARMLATTIQALEVQRMTLSTLQNMNVSAEALRDALKIRMPEPSPAKPRAAEPRTAEARTEPARETAEEVEAEEADTETTTKSAAGKKGDGPGEGAVDPMQWWGALTRQFATLATNTMTEALKETATATESARNLAAAVTKPAAGGPGEASGKAGATRKSSAKAGRAAAGSASKPGGAAKAPARRPTRAAPKN